MVVLVTASPLFPSRNNFVKALAQCAPKITTILQNINPGRTSLVLGEQGKNSLRTRLYQGTPLRLHVPDFTESFYRNQSQIQTEVLYRTAVSFAGLTGKETVVDAYCGIGTIGLIASRHAKSVIGVELNRDAVGMPSPTAGA